MPPPFNAAEHPQGFHGWFVPTGGAARSLASIPHVPGYGYGGLYGPAGNVSATIRYQTPPVLAPGTDHLAAWVGVASGDGGHWLQVGLTFQADGKAFVYVETINAKGHYQLRNLGPASPGVSYRVAVQQTGKTWTALLNGRPVGSVSVPGVSSSAAVVETEPGGAAAAQYTFDFSGVHAPPGTGAPSANPGASVSGSRDAFTVSNATVTKAASVSLRKPPPVLVRKADPGTLYLIRHGKTALNSPTAGPGDRIRGWENVPLDPEGRKQADMLAREFEGLGLDSLYSSDLSRAADTAAKIGASTGLPVHTSGDFRPWNLGVFQGQESETVAPKVEEYVRNPGKVVPEGESFDSFRSRFLSAFEALLDQVKAGQTVGLVSHYRCVKLAEAWLDDGQQGVDVDVAEFLSSSIDPGDVVCITWDDGKWAWTTKDVGKVSLRKRDYPTLVHEHELDLDPDAEDELRDYFDARPDVRAGETAEHGIDPLADPACYLAAEQDEGYHDSLQGKDSLGIADVKAWETEEDAAVKKEQPTASDVHVDTPSTEVSVATLDDTGKKKRKRKPLKIDDTDVQVLKVDDERRIVYGIVLEPNVEDSQGDVVSKDDVELAAHRFLYRQAPIGVQHGALAPDTVRPVENFIAPCDFEMGADPETGEPNIVRKGSWVLATHVPDEALWAEVKKAGFGGYSVAGTGKRAPLGAEVVKDDPAPAKDEDAWNLVDRLTGLVAKLAGRPQPEAPPVHVHFEPGAFETHNHLPEQTVPEIHNHVAAPDAPEVHAHVTVEQPKPRSVRVETADDGSKRYVPED